MHFKRKAISHNGIKSRIFSAMILATLLFLMTATEGLSKKSDLQFFGDLYVPYHVIKETKSTRSDPKVFRKILPLLLESDQNIANLEAPLTFAQISPVDKKYILKMPPWSVEMLKRVGITAVGLGNNHSFDYGYFGYFETLATLEANGILHTGVGDNLEEASKPMLISTRFGKACIYSFNRTLPEDFWAGKNKPGTAYLSFEKTIETVRGCLRVHPHTFVSIHWGSEGYKKAKPYQKKLAKLLIDEGVTAVFGHHPHVVQEVEKYKGKYIFYSLGNFVFGTRPMMTRQEGIAVAVNLDKKRDPSYGVTLLNVQNKEVNFFSDLKFSDNSPPPKLILPKSCKKQSIKSYTRYLCK